MKKLSLETSRLDGRYDVQEYLGTGSYAEIFLARDIRASTNSPHCGVVIKALNVFLQGDLDDDLERTLVENFQNEAIALDRVRHPNIVSRLGHGTAKDLNGTVFHYLILEYLSGGDLSKVIKKQRLSLLQAFAYLEQICAAVAHAHKCGIIHRDIKPQNILLTKDQKVAKLCDFGVAKINISDEPITRVGTNIYAPPEHSPSFIDTQGEIQLVKLTPASDIYSLAKTAYVLLTGESPRRFANTAISELPLTMQGDIWANSLLRVLQKATQFEAKNRYQTITDFWHDLMLVKIQIDEPEIETQVAVRVNAQPSASFSSGFSPNVPAAPKFDTSRNIKIPVQVESNPKVIVKLQDSPYFKSPPVLPVDSKISQIPDIALPKKASSLFRKIIYAILFVFVFGGALYLTHNYLRNSGILPEFRIPFTTQTGVADRDMNIRRFGGTDQDKIGILTKGSKVKILNTKENWMEISIIEHGRPKDDPNSADRGWVSKTYINLD
jgi:serine/threonine protein kinase